MKPNILEVLREMIDVIESGYEFQLEKVDSSYHAYFFPVNNRGMMVRIASSVGRSHYLADAIHESVKNLEKAVSLEESESGISDRMKTLTMRKPKKEKRKK